MKYQTSWFVIKVWCKSSVLASIPSTESTRGCVQKKSRNTSKYWRPRTFKWLGMGSSVFCLTKGEINGVQFLNNFWHLNWHLKCRPYPLPNIDEIILNLESFTYDTSLYLNIGYYHRHLSETANNLCTIIPPWRKHKYKRLTMVVSNPPEIFQEKMKNVPLILIHPSIHRWPLDNH